MRAAESAVRPAQFSVSSPLITACTLSPLHAAAVSFRFSAGCRVPARGRGLRVTDDYKQWALGCSVVLVRYTVVPTPTYVRPMRTG